MAADVADPDPSGLDGLECGDNHNRRKPGFLKLPSLITTQVPRVIDIHHTPFHSFLVACDRIIGHNKTVLRYHRAPRAPGLFQQLAALNIHICLLFLRAKEKSSEDWQPALVD